jgi:drug/metabolite transporter (DMT)-like permease
MDKTLGFVFLGTYILAVGTGSFLQKFVMGKVSPYQLEVITAIGLFIVSVPALWIAQRNLHLPFRSVPLAWGVGFLFSIGSFVYVLAVSRLPVSVAAPVSTGYVVLAVALSAIFLKEQITLMKGVGILLTIVGVGILSIY